MWIVSCHIFFHNVFHLSTMFIHSSTLPVHQPFESVMGKSGVKTRSSEQSVLPVDADFLLVTDSSSEEDSERDDQSYPPRGACSNLAGVYCSYHAYGVLHCHAICLDWTFFVWMPPVCFLYQICELCNAMFFSQLSYLWIMHRHGARHHICELSHAIFFFVMYSICRQSVYIELLFMCISHLSRLWKN